MKKRNGFSAAARVLALLLSVLAVSVPAFSDGFSGSVYTAGVTKYLWRGQVLSDGFAVQPGITLNAGKVSFVYWASVHEYSSDMQLNESDYTISFSDAVPYADFLSITAGFTAYNFPYGAVGQRTSVEVFAGISSSVPSAPYLKYFYDTMLGNGGYLEGGISHSVPVGDFKLTGSAVCGYNFGQWMDPSLTVAGFTLSAAYSIAGFTFTPSAFYQIALDAQYENLFFASLAVNYDFSF